MSRESLGPFRTGAPVLRSSRWFRSGTVAGPRGGAARDGPAGGPRGRTRPAEMEGTFLGRRRRHGRGTGTGVLSREGSGCFGRLRCHAGFCRSKGVETLQSSWEWGTSVLEWEM